MTILATAVFAGAGCVSGGANSGTNNAAAVVSATTTADPPSAVAVAQKPGVLLAEPIRNALSRVTKKSFGLEVNPGHSPVSPEKFSGYHTGVDFETLTDEQAVDVPIFALCSGPLLLKKWASGYGGVLVQQCRIEAREVTVIYGHLRLASIQNKIGDELTAGRELGVLGKGYSSETDGERKHLHLGIHLGTTVNIRGYVPDTAELKQWLDVRTFLQTPN